MSRFLEALRKLYPRPQWAVFSEVRSTTGDSESARFADYVAVNVWPSGQGQVILFEEKASRGDFRREVREPEKAVEIGRFCSQRYFIVPAPWKNVILSEREIPRGWGLLEIGTGAPAEVIEAEKTQPIPMSEGFVRSLIRAGDVQGSAGSAPESVIVRPSLSRHHVGLGCGHVAPMPLAKRMPGKMPCLSCEAGHPSDSEIVEAVIDDAEPEELERWAALIAQRLGRDAA